MNASDRKSEVASQVGAAITAIHAIGESIRTLGTVPSGQLYAMVCGSMDLAAYQGAIGLLKRAKLVSEDSSHMLRWTGPVLP